MKILMFIGTLITSILGTLISLSAFCAGLYFLLWALREFNLI